MGSLLFHESGGGEGAPTTDGHARSSSMGFLFEARIAAAGPVEMPAIVRSVGRFIGGQGLSLLPASINSSPLQTPTTGMRSFH